MPSFLHDLHASYMRLPVFILCHNFNFLRQISQKSISPLWMEDSWLKNIYLRASEYILSHYFSAAGHMRHCTWKPSVVTSCNPGSIQGTGFWLNVTVPGYQRKFLARDKYAWMLNITGETLLKVPSLANNSSVLAWIFMEVYLLLKSSLKGLLEWQAVYFLWNVWRWRFPKHPTQVYSQERIWVSFQRYITKWAGLRV